MLRAGKLRHHVNVMRPAEATDERGRRRGEPTIIRRDVPCSIETLNGRELEIARTIVATATYRVQMYGDPGTPLTRNDYLQFGSRELFIGHIEDKQQNGLELTLICGEQVSG